MNERLKRLRDAVRGNRGREVEVTPEGTVRERQQREAEAQTEGREPATRKATKLAARTFARR